MVTVAIGNIFTVIPVCHIPKFNWTFSAQYGSDLEMWRRCRSKWLEGWVQPDGIEAPILAQDIPWVLHKLQWLSNSGVSYSASARLSRLCTVLTASLLLNEDLLDPTLIPFQLPNSTLMLLDSLFHECPFYLEPTTTTYSVPLIITPASCCWMNLILFNLLSALLNLLITLLPYVYIPPFPPSHYPHAFVIVVCTNYTFKGAQS